MCKLTISPFDVIYCFPNLPHPPPPGTGNCPGKGRGGTLLAPQSPTNSIQSIFFKDGPLLHQRTRAAERDIRGVLQPFLRPPNVVYKRPKRLSSVSLWVYSAVSPWLGRWQAGFPAPLALFPPLPPCSILPESGGHDSRYRIGEGGVEGGGGGSAILDFSPARTTTPHNSRWRLQLTHLY
jgi:hypothetical protein